MKTIGIYLKEGRAKKRYSRGRVARETKIKEGFIEAIEKENWDALPEFPIVVGFVKGISKFLKLDEKQSVALLRRDYPPKVLPINPKPDISKRFVWSPKLTFLIGVVIATVAVLTYLGFQYANFISPPKLVLSEPSGEEPITVKENTLLVSGKADPDATVKVNNQPVLVEDDGSFKVEIQVFEGTDELIVKAISRSGKESVVKRKIKPELGS